MGVGFCTACAAWPIGRPARPAARKTYNPLPAWWCTHTLSFHVTRYLLYKICLTDYFYVMFQHFKPNRCFCFFSKFMYSCIFLMLILMCRIVLLHWGCNKITRQYLQCSPTVTGHPHMAIPSLEQDKDKYEGTVFCLSGGHVSVSLQ